MELPINYDKSSTRVRKKAREEYTRVQEGLCCYCNSPLTGEPSEAINKKSVRTSLFPPYFFSNPVHLHHNHETGITIGSVHAKCNAVSWQYDKV